MLDFKRLLFHEVGERVRRLREKTGYPKAGLIRKMELSSGGQVSADTNWIIDQGTLTKVEQGVAGKRNPYLLSANQIRYMAKVFGITPKELVWGDEAEREGLAQLILLAVVADRAKTSPVYFFGEGELLEFFGWAKKQQCLDARQREIALHAAQLTKEMPKGLESRKMKLKDGSCITVADAYKELSAFFGLRYGVFYSGANKARYGLLHNDRADVAVEDRLDYRREIANTVLTSMMTDMEYMKQYTKRMLNQIRSNDYDAKAQRTKGIAEWEKDKRLSVDVAMDYGEYEYYLFVDAFHLFWDGHKQAIMGVLDEHVFNADFIDVDGLKRAVRGINGCESKLLEALLGVDDASDKYVIAKALGESYYSQSLQHANALKRYEAADTDIDEFVRSRYLNYTKDILALTDKEISIMGRILHVRR